MFITDTQASVAITPPYLASLNKLQLADLLANRTKLLLTASTLKLTDHAYVEELRKEVQQIQAELELRKTAV